MVSLTVCLFPWVVCLPSDLPPTRVHPHLLYSVAEMLAPCLVDGIPSDKVLERAFKGQRKWGARDRRLIAELFYSTVRNWSLRFWQLTGKSQEEISAEAVTSPGLSRAVVLLQALQQGTLDFPLAQHLLKQLDFSMDPVRDRLQSQPPHVWLERSVPVALWQRLEQELGAGGVDHLFQTSSQPAELFLRVNTLKCTDEELLKSLRSEEVVVESLGPVALVVRERRSLFRSQAFQSGWFEVQDIHSQKVAPFLDPQPGERVIDACAGAGGKTLHLAQLMKNRGSLIAMDIHEGKLKELDRRARRAGVSCLQSRLIESSKVIKRQDQSADRVLLDVPCSGTGVMRRNPDSKWRLRPEDLERLSGIQQEILRGYSRMVKPGGVLVYSTCSVLPSENSQQVQRWLESTQGWTLEEELTCPVGEGDGFYMARLRRS